MIPACVACICRTLAVSNQPYSFHQLSSLVIECYLYRASRTFFDFFLLVYLVDEISSLSLVASAGYPWI